MDIVVLFCAIACLPLSGAFLNPWHRSVLAPLQASSSLEATALENKLAVTETINKFGLSIDLRDWDTFRGLFTDPVGFDYSSIGEKAGDALHPDDVVGTASKDLGNFQATQHVITNHVIDLDGESAHCRAHVRAVHFLPNDQGEATFEMGGHYEAKLIQEAGQWKINEWKFHFLWSTGNEELFDIARNSVNQD